ncbi:MAG: AAA family ATPase [Enhygromyxa sp.]
MITRLAVRNFKSLRELEVEFGRLTVIVGPNGCGKSSVLQAIELLRDLAVGEDFKPSPSVLSRPASGQAPVHELFARAEFGSGKHVQNTLILQGGELNPKDLFEFDSSAAAELFERVQLYRLDRVVMEQPAYSEEANPTVGPRGEHLAAVLDALQGTWPEHFDTIESGLRELVPGLRRVRLPRVKLEVRREVLVGDQFRMVKDSAVGHQITLDFEFAQGIAADQASEGTILLLGLLTVIGAEPGPPTTIMLDDLDRGLHPKAQKQLIGHLRQLLDRRPDLQILATTHSPYLVEHLAYDEVLAMTQSPDDGRSLAAPLADHPDAERWREEMSAGEFWSSVGEDWLQARGG